MKPKWTEASFPWARIKPPDSLTHIWFVLVYFPGGLPRRSHLRKPLLNVTGATVGPESEGLWGLCRGARGEPGWAGVVFGLSPCLFLTLFHRSTWQGADKHEVWLEQSLATFHTPGYQMIKRRYDLTIKVKGHIVVIVLVLITKCDVLLGNDSH